MSTKRRIWHKGAMYHVMGRGVRKTDIFKDEDDRVTFLLILQKVQEETGVEIYSLCLMTNHFHILLKTAECAIWNTMNKLMSRYARVFNRKYGYKGHLFDSRYNSGLVEDERYFLECSRYIHLNPVKANMVKTAEEYPYSNYYLFAGVDEKRERNKEIQKHLEAITSRELLLSVFSSTREAGYRKYVEEKTRDNEQDARIGKEIGE